MKKKSFVVFSILVLFFSFFNIGIVLGETSNEEITQNEDVVETEKETKEESGTNNNEEKQETYSEQESMLRSSSISEGVYYIASALDENKVLEALNGSNSNGTNVVLKTNNKLEFQKWYVKSVGDNSYEIVSYNNLNQSLDVPGASSVVFTNLWTYQKNSSVAQRWKIVDAGDGYYNIISECNNLVVDIAGGSTKNGTNVQFYVHNGTNAQKFKFIKYEENDRLIDDGNYMIKAGVGDSKYIDISSGNTRNGNNIQLYQSNYSWAQVWSVKYLNDGYYSITSFLSNKKSLDVASGKIVDGQNIQLWDVNNSSAQKWLIKDAGDGYYYIITNQSHKYLDIASGSGSNGANVQIYTGNGSKAQKFKFEKYIYKRVEDGIYNIDSAVNNQLSVSMSNEVGSSNTNVLLDQKSDENRKKWYISNNSDGSYSILAVVNKNKKLGSLSSSVANGLNVQLIDSNRRWYFISNDDGSYSIVCAENGKALDISGNLIQSGTNIQLWEKNNSGAQKFSFSPTDINVYQKSYDDGYYVIGSKKNHKKVLDVYAGRKENGTNVQLWDRNNSTAQVWKLKYIDNGYYEITSSMNLNTSLNLKDSGMSNGTNIDLHKINKGDGQTWLLKDYGDGYVSIISKKNGLYLDVASGNAVNGANIQVYQGNGTDAQKFKLERYNGVKKYTGIDVSSHQKVINWQEVSDYGIGFAVIRIGYGADYSNQDDVQFLYNVEQAEKYNIPYAVYLYSYAKTAYGVNSADSEANHVLRVLNIIKSKGFTPTLGKVVFYDMEDDSTIFMDRDQYFNRDNLMDVAKSFCTKIQNNGYECGIYANRNWFNNILDAVNLARNYAIWLAEYPSGVNSFSNLGDIKPSYNATPYKFWQFCSDGTIPGIGGLVDLDIGYDIFD